MEFIEMLNIAVNANIQYITTMMVFLVGFWLGETLFAQCSSNNNELRLAMWMVGIVTALVGAIAGDVNAILQGIPV